jgi:hypothetical protein
VRNPTPATANSGIAAAKPSPGSRGAKRHQRALAWLKGRGEAVFYLPQLYQLGPAGIRDKAAAAKVVGVLVEHGYLEQVAGGAEIAGKWRRDVWRLVTED